MNKQKKILEAFNEAEEIALISTGEINIRAQKIINLLDDLIPEHIFQGVKK